MRISIQSAFLLGLFFTFSSCSLINNTTAVLWTNRPELASYVEFFNADQEEYRIELVYKEYPHSGFEDRPPDLVVSSHLASASILANFKSLNSLFDDGILSEKSFYPGILDPVTEDEEIRLLPLSFDLPALMFSTHTTDDQISDFFIDLNDLKALSVGFNKDDSGTWTNMGFAPRWNGNFILAVSLLFGANFRESSNNEITWNQEKLDAAISYLKRWSEASNGGTASEISFENKYLYEPEYKLIAEDRIQFAYTTASEFFLLPEEKRKPLDFRWIALNNKIPILEDIVFIGISSSSKNHRPSSAFISWILNPQNQERLLENTQFKRMRTFGICNGFSSLPEVNERSFPNYYRELVGHIPPAAYLLLQPRLPIYWERIKQEAILPWLLREIDSKNENSLEKNVHSWLLQAPEF